MTSLEVFSPGINSHSFITLTGLKKCVIQTLFNKSIEECLVISLRGMPDVFELTIALELLCSSIFLKISCFIFIFSTTTSHIQSKSFILSKSLSKLPTSILFYLETSEKA